MLSNTITDVFFDLDHTLWDFDANSELAFTAILKKDHPALNVSDFIEKYIPINQACWKLYQNDEITHIQLRYNRLKFTFDALEYFVTDTQIENIAQEYIQLLPENNYLFDGAVELLEYLEKKYKLHIITNGFADVQYKKIKNSNIGGFFKTVTNSEMAGVKKPNPTIFEHALHLANAKRENSVMIGDCLDADVQGALNAGLDAIFFNDKKVKVREDIKQVTHLLELKKYL
ncbi:YjjG family noncanonical pyrimidine nucleotidase [Flavobacterium adhaerens]|uniref:YjjG family noncanonical pyrimidine nucleotidase n=1 Tax=Flavobacterium adhaerens TaxID=3149043 RepID=UPI0032B5598B